MVPFDIELDFVGGEKPRPHDRFAPGILRFPRITDEGIVKIEND